MYYHMDDAIEIRKLEKNPTNANLEEIEIIRGEQDNLLLFDRLCKYFPPKPTQKEIESD